MPHPAEVDQVQVVQDKLNLPVVTVPPQVAMPVSQVAVPPVQQVEMEVVKITMPLLPDALAAAVAELHQGEVLLQQTPTTELLDQAVDHLQLDLVMELPMVDSDNRVEHQAQQDLLMDHHHQEDPLEALQVEQDPIMELPLVDLQPDLIMALPLVDLHLLDLATELQLHPTKLATVTELQGVTIFRATESNFSTRSRSHFVSISMCQ